jgi:hypothetical protein
MDRKKTRIGTIMLMLGVAISGNAQSGTYNHDSSKKNQITVMEIGSGSLSPELYYQLLHSSYKKSAAFLNQRFLHFSTSVNRRPSSALICGAMSISTSMMLRL